MSPGEKLPSEERLCRRFGASRTVIREAIQQLKGRGLLRTTRGSGTFIADPCLTTLRSAVAAYSAFAMETDFLELIDFRILVETECAGLAAREADQSIVRNLRSLQEQMSAVIGNRERFSEIDIAFHLCIAQGSKNRMYATLLSALEKRCIDYAQANRGDDAWYEGVLITHDEILQAIADGDPVKAKEAMMNHLISSRQHFVGLETESHPER